MDEWIIGRANIQRALGVTHWQTVLKWRKRYGLEWYHLPNRKPAILRSALNSWIRKTSKLATHPQSINLVPYKAK